MLYSSETLHILKDSPSHKEATMLIHIGVFDRIVSRLTWQIDALFLAEVIYERRNVSRQADQELLNRDADGPGLFM
jgi:hypothetical protein